MVTLHETIRKDEISAAQLLRGCFEYLQLCSLIATQRCAKTRRRESRVANI